MRTIGSFVGTAIWAIRADPGGVDWLELYFTASNHAQLYVDTQLPQLPKSSLFVGPVDGKPCTPGAFVH
jgi:hypothetical protein